MSLIWIFTVENIKNKVTNLNLFDGFIPKLFKNRGHEESGHKIQEKNWCHGVYIHTLKKVVHNTIHHQG